MAEPYKIVIGLEVHVQLLTRTKLFCGCRNQFGLPPNTATCPSLPRAAGVAAGHERAGVQTLRACGARTELPDRQPPRLPPRVHQVGPQELLLPRPAQELPDFPVRPAVQPRRLARNQRRKRREEGLRARRRSASSARTSKRTPARTSTTRAAGAATREVDLNRTGTPLLEIVSHPDMHTPGRGRRVPRRDSTAAASEIGVSDCEMQEGRCGATRT